MDYTARLKIVQIDPEAPKGEEFDRVVEGALEDLDIEGCEVKSVELEREGGETASDMEYVTTALQEMGRIASGQSSKNNGMAFDQLTPLEQVERYCQTTLEHLGVAKLSWELSEGVRKYVEEA